jgi:hypothetical protein
MYMVHSPTKQVNMQKQAQRQTVREFLDRILFENQRLLLSLVFLFAIVNGIMLVLTEKIGPPDFYKLYGVTERLFSGDLNVGITPPLFPLLLYPPGKLIAVFTSSADAFIIAGRLISLVSGLGVLWFSYLFLEKIVGKFALLGLTFLVISPWYLKLLAFPITDMLYLLFVSAAFYGFLKKSSPGWTTLAVVAGVLTRYEGILLIVTGFLNFFKMKKKYFYILLAALPVVLILFFIFASRIFAHLTDIILPQKSYLYVLLHPMDFFNLLYGSILYFIPYSYPYLPKLALLIVLITFFLYGLYRLFKIEKRLTIALAVYEFLFFAAKGYLDVSDPEREFRRIFSGVWIFYILSFIGCYFFLKKIKPLKAERNLALMGSGIVLIVLAVSQKLITVPLIFPALLILPALVVPLKNLSIGKVPKYLAVVILLVFALQIYHTSYDKAETYVVDYARKAAYATAQWLNVCRLKHGAVLLSYTDNNIVDYYLDKKRQPPKNIRWIHFTVPLRNTEENRQQFIQLFFQELEKQGVDYIIFDNYVVRKPEFTGINDVQRMLFEERNNRKLFHIKTNLFYKGENVGYVLKSAHDQTNH